MIPSDSPWLSLQFAVPPPTPHAQACLSNPVKPIPSPLPKLVHPGPPRSANHRASLTVGTQGAFL